MLPAETGTHQEKESQARPGEVVTDSTRRPGFPVVGVGASAGGLDAFTRLLGNLPPKPGMAILFIQHLDPKRESILPELLAARSPMPVRHAQQGMHLEPNQVYVSPPNAIVTVTDGHLQVSPRPEIPRLFMPVDFMLRSLASTMGRRAIGVVLSGGGTDGALGMQAIKEVDGITFAQDEKSAAQDSMPRSAILTGCVDYVLDPAGIAHELLQVGSHPYLATPAEPATTELITDGEEAELQKIFALIRRYSGVDFTRYKRSTILRRVRRRMILRRVEHLSEYPCLLQNEPEEISALYQDFLIRVTSFFRDPKSFDVLSREIFPILIKQRPTDEPIRIWVSGCATGEEVYSIAIGLMETLGDHSMSTPVKILATDVNERALEVARAGMYIENIAADVSPERLRRFFTQVDNCYQICKSIRDICIFSRHDISRDPPFARLDLITCRNLLIYLNLAVQRRVLPLFHYALKPGGYLMLGPSETIGAYSELFTPVNSEHKIFAKEMTATRPHLEFDLADPFKARDPRLVDMQREPVVHEPVGFSLVREVDRLLLSQFAPAGVLIDDELRIIQFRGQTDPYLAPAPGLASFDLLKMAREGLMAELRTAVNLARDRNEPVRRRAVRIERDGGNFPVEIEVRPLRLPASGPRYFLVLFEPKPGPNGAKAPAAESVSPQTEVGITSLDEAQARRQVIELRGELDVARNYLQTIAEENDTRNEELNSANEEILSSNEELQSTNEELQSAKEEMQSANEELSTVNDELKHRNLELARVNDDLINLFGCVNIPIVMVSRDLRIRRFTSPAERLLNLLATDIGRPIRDIRGNLDFPDLDRRIEAVIETLAPEDHEVVDLSGHWYSVRIRPYITVENKIDGAVVALVDVDHVKRAVEQLKEARDRAKAIVETVWQPLVVLDPALRVMRANRAFLRMFGTSQEKVEGRPLPELGPGPWMNQDLVAALRTIPTTGQPLPYHEIDVDLGALGNRVLQVYACPIDWDDPRDRTMIFLAMEDVTDRKREQERKQQLLREQAARIEAERANRRKDEFLAMLAHELRNPLAPILNSVLVLGATNAQPSDVAWALKILERQVRHMSRLIEDLLDVSRVMRGAIQLRKEPSELSNLIDHAIEVTRSFIETRRHQLTVTLPEEPITLNVDPIRIEQVVTNLLHNAAKYTPEGGQINLSVARENGQAVIRVRDNGIGIAPEHIHEIFDLFMQVDNSLERSLGGLGIGLTLVKSLTELHAGSVEAHSDGLGEGSEFTVRLPALSSQIESNQAFAVPPLSTPPRKVLIVDDNNDSAEALSRLLRSQGHEVRTALDGASALAVADQFRPDLVLLDIGMPVISGFDIASRLRAKPEFNDVVIIAVSGYGKEDSLDRSREADCDDYAVKPIDLDKLTELMRRTRRRE
ncbi:MAG: chemotaxis protein CheB [Isosphaeraceae bacterium]